MTGAAIGRTRSLAGAAPIRLSCDRGGTWTVSEADGAVRAFPGFEAALDSARHAGRKAAIEIWQGGEYICCLSPSERADDAAPIGTGPGHPPRKVFATLERYANHGARIMMATAGPVFWLAIAFAVVAASLGWRLALL